MLTSRFRRRGEDRGEGSSYDGHEYVRDATVYPRRPGLKPKSDVCKIKCPESDCHPGQVFGTVGGDPNSCHREAGCP